MRGSQSVFVAQMRCTCCTRVGPTEAFLMSEIPCQTQISKQATWLGKRFQRLADPQQRPATCFFKLFLRTQLWASRTSLPPPSTQNPVGVQLFLHIFFLPRRWLSGAWPITNPASMFMPTTSSPIGFSNLDVHSCCTLLLIPDQLREQKTCACTSSFLSTWALVRSADGSCSWTLLRHSSAARLTTELTARLLHSRLVLVFDFLFKIHSHSSTHTERDIASLQMVSPVSL